MCQDQCQNPPEKSCSFYCQCAEAQMDCGPTSYALAYGEKNCNKFGNNLKLFSSDSQDWIFGTMHCFQLAVVQILEPCTATCDSFRAAALASHPSYYGFCSLKCLGILAVLFTVVTDLFTLESLKQVIRTGDLCLNKISDTLSGCRGDVLLGGRTACFCCQSNHYYFGSASS